MKDVINSKRGRRRQKRVTKTSARRREVDADWTGEGLANKKSKSQSQSETRGGSKSLNGSGFLNKAKGNCTGNQPVNRASDREAGDDK